MFLENYLFFSNIIFISFCYTYIKVLVFDNKLEFINRRKKQLTKDLFNERNDYKSQLKFVTKKQEINDYDFKIFGWKVIFFLVAIFMALTLIRTEPISLFGVHLKWSLILLIILLNLLFFKILSLLGVKK